MLKKKPLEFLGKTGKKINLLGLVVGPILFAIVMLLPIEGLSAEGKVVLALVVWMVTWWITEAVPLYVTALLPLVVLTASSVLPFGRLSASYADPMVFLLFGGFILAKAIEKTGLHQRFALTVLRAFPNGNPKLIIAAFMIVTASISAWMCNTATTIMMLPIALAVISEVPNSGHRERFGTALMIAIAYAAAIGGIVTLVGTPANAMCAAISQKMFNVPIEFSQWMMMSIPIAAVSLLIAGWYIVKVGLRIGNESLHTEKNTIMQKLADLGKMTTDQKLVLAVFAITAGAWMSRILWKDVIPFLDNPAIAIVAALALFIIPSKSSTEGRLLEKETVQKIPWGVLLLIGGSLALAGGFEETGLNKWIAGQMIFLQGAPELLILFGVVGAAMLITQVMVNTGAGALMIPVAATLASVLGVPPLLLMVPAAIGASYAFTLPISTPPNMVILGSGHVTTKHLIKVGVPLTLILLIVVTLMSWILGPLVFG